MKDIPLSLYVHFPWCVKKCPYCDFNSHDTQLPIPEAEYIDCLIRDLHAEATLHNKTSLSSIFLGGGTPSLFSAAGIARLMDSVRALYETSASEITLEANPGATDSARLAGYRKSGINRLSLGAQSFDDSSLMALGRIHRSSDTLTAFQAARDAGFDNINLDLMHGLPGQSVSSALQDLKAALSLEPEHISWYQLTIEQNTVFYRSPPQLPSEDKLASIFDEGRKLLQESGFQQYEVSAFSRPNKRAVHNLNYWQFGDYIGIGAGAHGKQTTPEGVFRTSKTRTPRDYMRAPRSSQPPGNLIVGKSNRHRIDDNDLPAEFLMNLLRLDDGFTATLYEERTGLPYSTLSDFLAKACQKKLVTVTEKNGETQVQTTQLGGRFLDSLLLEII